MGKRVKKKAQNALKEKRVSASSSKAILKETNHAPSVVDEEVVVVKERKLCTHFEKGVDVARVCSKLESAESTGCGDCRDGASGRKGGKGKGKQGKSKGGSKATWICLLCGHFSCGGVGLPNYPQTHAVRHASQNRHPLVIQMENNNLRWCFTCSNLIPVETLDDNGEQKDVLLDIVKLLKNQSSKTTSVDVEDIWFGSGSVLNDVKSENKVVILPNNKDPFAVRGLVNLGNTCFFNSVMQNLLAVDILREYLLTFDGFMGPLTSALKKIFIETSPESGLRNVINPKPLFGCICAKASQFRGYQQQDSHELLRCLLDGLSTEDSCEKKSNKPSRENGTSPTFIDSIFGGQISSSVCCVECGHSSVVHEPFLDLSLPLPTKKPPPKKVQPVPRTRKTKQPPKRFLKPRPKHNKDGEEDSRPTVSGCDPSSSNESSTVFKVVSPGCSSSADLVEPGVLADGQGLGSQVHISTQPDNATTQLSENGTHVEVEIQLDDQEADSWLDFLGPVATNDAQEAGPLLDDQQPVSLSDDYNIDAFQDAVNSTEMIDVNTNDDNVKPKSIVYGCEEDQPVRVKDNEVLLLTYKDDSATTVAEMPPLAMADEEDTADFVGLGDLFDEPEATATTSVISNLGNGFLAGNSTESDPDEVDNTGSPVSIESCLAHYVRAELLTGEHAWHCEKCSKLQIGDRQKLKNHRESIPVQSASFSDCANSVSIADGNEKLKTHDPEQVNGFTPGLAEEKGERNEPESPVESNPGINPHCCSTNGEHFPAEKLSRSGEDEDEVEDHKTSKSVKVMRDATKRMLISKIPTILTIHLKRFGQDARGRLSKLNGHVVFKEFIDLRPYLDNRCVRDNCIYRLIGVVEHSGSMRGGHYIAYVRGARRRSDEDNLKQRHNTWYYASDAHVRETTLEEVLRSEAYILFYEKVQL